MNIKVILAVILALLFGLFMGRTNIPAPQPDPIISDFPAPDNPNETGGSMHGDVFPSAAEIVGQMKLGWNLGNTLDALGMGTLDDEMAWGNPVTTKEMVDRVKAAGFNVMRVPVSWGKHLDSKYNIDKAWLKRVREVVDYGIDNNMYVILNTHHEEWYMPRQSDVDEDLRGLGRLWEQIAEEFKDYDERLLFEGVNEPRLRGDSAEWWGTPEAREIVNRYAETFVRTVRASGGNNAQRSLLVTPYAASSATENLQALKIPDNAGNIIVSVHAYLPYDFALNVHGTASYSNDGSANTLMSDIKTLFLDKGIPVVITEFGSVNKENEQDRIQCAVDFLNAAKATGVPCCWWDNNARWGDGELFGLLDRNGGGWYFPTLLQRMMETAGV
ncbi:MAG: glycoside hydrolase family 5 protein [Oscillospiraceae bacterium]|nr:glycoside hydrolase family 5 protein [Oscillospiraceae bacterium]